MQDSPPQEQPAGDPATIGGLRTVLVALALFATGIPALVIGGTVSLFYLLSADPSFQWGLVSLGIGVVFTLLGAISTIGLFTVSAAKTARDLTRGDHAGAPRGRWLLALGFSTIVLATGGGVFFYVRSVLYPPALPSKPPPPPSATSTPPAPTVQDALNQLRDPTTRLRGLETATEVGVADRLDDARALASEIVPLLKSRDPRLRAAACTALSHLRRIAKTAFADLVPLVEGDPVPAVRREAIWALLGADRAQAVPVLIQALSALRAERSPLATTDQVALALVKALAQADTREGNAALAELAKAEPALGSRIPARILTPRRPRRTSRGRMREFVTQKGVRYVVERVRRGASLRLRGSVWIALDSVSDGATANLTVTRGPFVYGVALGVDDRLYLGRGVGWVRRLTADKVVLWWSPDIERIVGLEPPRAPDGDPLSLPAMGVYRLADGRTLTVGSVRNGSVSLRLYPADYEGRKDVPVDRHDGARAGVTLTGKVGTLELLQLEPSTRTIRGRIGVRVR